MAGLEWLRAPPFLLQVMQFLYRYLGVLRGEVMAMRVAGLSRGGSMGTLQLRHAAAMAGSFSRVRTYGLKRFIVLCCLVDFPASYRCCRMHQDGRHSG